MFGVAVFGHSSISDAKFQHVASVLAGLIFLVFDQDLNFYATATCVANYFFLLSLQNGLTMMRTAVPISLLSSQRSFTLITFFSFKCPYVQTEALKMQTLISFEYELNFNSRKCQTYPPNIT